MRRSARGAGCRPEPAARGSADDAVRQRAGRAIVKLDDLGLALSRKTGAPHSIGPGILAFAPWLMKALSVAGTAAMFLVGGGILVHGVPQVAHAVEGFAAQIGNGVAWLIAPLANALSRVTAAVVLLVWTAIRRPRGKH